MKATDELVDALAAAAWAVLNFDNPHDGQEHNAATWEHLTGEIRKVLRHHRKKRKMK